VLLRLALAAAAVACEHPEPIGTALIEDNPQMPTAGIGLRLTYSSWRDQAPVWLPDGSLVGFSWPRPSRADGDRCLAFLSLTSRRIVRAFCLTGPGDDDSTNMVRVHAVSAGGSMAFIAEGGSTFGPLSNRTLRVGRDDHPDRAVSVASFPVQSATGLIHVSAEQLAWQGESTLVYLAIGIEPGPQGRTAGLEIARLVLGAAGFAASVVPNTVGATSVAVDPVTGILYGTFAGDPLLYALDGASGARQAVADFSGLATPRDVKVVGGRIIAVVQGRVTPVAAFGIITQFDEGGELAIGRIGGAAPALLISESSRWFRHPALSPTGDQVVAEAFLLDVHARFPGVEDSPIDTLVSPLSDLMLIGNP